MSNSNSTINQATPVLSSSALPTFKRRTFKAEDFTVRGVASDFLTSIGASAKNAAMLGVATVEVMAAWLPIVKDLGYTSVEFGEMTAVGLRQTILELNIMLEEWRKDSCIPEEIRDFNVPMSELVKKTMQARADKKKKADEEAKKEILQRINSSDSSEEVKEILRKYVEETSIEEASRMEQLVAAVGRKVVETSSSGS